MTLDTVQKSLLAVVAAGALGLIASRLAGAEGAAVALKMLASTGFLALAVASGASETGYGRWLLAGLAFSWAGDLALELDAGLAFLAGLVLFLLAHLAYVAAFAIHGMHGRTLLLAAIPVAAVSLVVLVWLDPWVGGDLRWPVRVYTLVISAMVVAAAGARGAGAPLLVPAGALCFYVSDLSVAAGQFVEPGFPNYAWGLPLYFGGQAMLALSVAIVRRRGARAAGL